MSELKFQLPIPPPRRVEGTRLPAALTALLGLVFALQLAWPSPVELPEVLLAPPVRLRPLHITPAAADPMIVARPIFAPGRNDAAPDANGGASGPSAPVDGARAVGVIAVGGTARAFLQGPDGRTEIVGPGARYRGWTVTGIARNTVTLRRGVDQATLAVMASAPPKPPATAEQSEDEPQ
jgi:hypothetical protein